MLKIRFERENVMNIKLTQKTKKYLSVIQEAKESGNLAIFVGAGFSVSENNKKYKSWSGVTKKLIKELNCNKINIGIVEENEILKKWYASYGFVHIGTKKFDAFPFTCGYMEKKL